MHFLGAVRKQTASVKLAARDWHLGRHKATVDFECSRPFGCIRTEVVISRNAATIELENRCVGLPTKIKRLGDLAADILRNTGLQRPPFKVRKTVALCAFPKM